MERPLPIVWFERCYLACVALGLVNFVLSWNTMMEQVAANPGAADLGPDFARNVAIGTVILQLILSLLLWYFVARKGSAIAKWVLAVFLVLGLLSVGFAAIAGTFPAGLPGIVSVVALVLQVIAIWQLFRPGTEAWFGENTASA